VGRFDPIGILGALEHGRVSLVVIGGLARVIQGAEEMTRGVDVTPSTKPDNLERLHMVLAALESRELEQQSAVVTTFETKLGELKIVHQPAGTRGYDDLRRAAAREPLGSGVRPLVASLGDLIRILGALGREEDVPRLRQVRRLAEIQHEHGIGLGL
jgi:hypothetical protein